MAGEARPRGATAHPTRLRPRPRPGDESAAAPRLACEGSERRALLFSERLLAQHAAAIIERLEDSDRSLRRWAVQALNKMEMSMLMEHVPAIVARFGDSDEDVHGLACKLLYGEGGESDDKALDRSLKGGVSEG